jgi:hypothetical protein
MKSREFVIAKYHRKTDWVKSLNGKVTIYNKSKDTLLPGEIFLEPNLGRCIHTYISHILSNYDDLSDEIFFSQDSPFEHVSDYVNIVNNIDKVDEFICITEYLQQQSKIITGLDGGVDIEITDFWNFLFTSNCPPICNFCVATHFAVNKKLILMRSKNFYLKIKFILETRYESPWEMERILPYWFDSQIIERKFIKH